MDSRRLRCVFSLLIIPIYVCHGQVVFQSSPEDARIREGGDAVFRCEATDNGSPVNTGWRLDTETSYTYLNNASMVAGIGSVRIITQYRSILTLSNVSLSINGSTVVCTAIASTLMERAAVIYIVSTPSYSTLPGQSTTPLEGSSFSHSFSLSGDTSPSFNWTKDGVDVSTDGRISTTASSIMIAGVQRTESGTYHVFGSNIAGTATASFVLDVIFPPEFSGTDITQTDVLLRGSPFTFNCTPGAANPAPSFSFMRDGSTYTEPAGNINGPVLTISSVVRADTGNYSCTATNTAGSTTLYHNLLVVAPPQYSLRAGQSTTPLEGSDFTYQFNLDNGAGGIEPSFTWSRAGTGGDLMNGNKYTLTADSITVKNVGRDDSVSYTVSATNMAGMHSISFTLDVQYPPEFTFPTVRSVQLNSRSQFAFDCTASAANPSSVDYSFRKDGSSQPFSASGPVLTISSVARANTGNYSCTANNTAGSTTLHYNLLVVAPPTSPLNLMVSGEMSFSAMAIWTPPTDDGGISHPSWTPPSPSSSHIIQYTVTYSNSSGSWSINNLNTSLVTLSNLQHSTDYTVTVAASNAHGQSTGVQGTFRTLDSKPILQAVVLAPLSLNNFTANVTFLTVGGQNVTNFSIRVNGTIVEGFTSESVAGDGKGVMVSVFIEDQSFTKGTYYSVEITATNSVGPSEPITGLMFVPNPPMITANFTEVSADDIPSTKCCAGLQLRLAEQPDVSDLKVLLTPQGGNQFTVNPAELSLEGFTLYFGGVQAGTDYTAVVTVCNIFGSSPEQQLLLKPLLGVPSNPNPPTVSVNGGQVTVKLSTAYPGTFKTSMFRFEIQFIKEEQRSSRQSKNVTHSVTPPAQSQDLRTAIRASYVDNLDPGSYSVSVTAVNEHGRSRAVMSQSTVTVTVPCSCPAPCSVNTVVIVLSIIIAVQFLLLVAMAIGCLVSHNCKLTRGGRMKSEDSSDDKKSLAEPVYTETEMGGGNYGDIALQSNVAYGTIEAGSKPPPPPQPTQSTSGGVGSEYEVVDTKKEEREKIVEGEGQYSNFSVLY